MSLQEQLVEGMVKAQWQTTPMTNNSMIRTVGLGSIGGQQTQEYSLYEPSSGPKVHSSLM